MATILWSTYNSRSYLSERYAWIQTLRASFLCTRNMDSLLANEGLIWYKIGRGVSLF